MKKLFLLFSAFFLIGNSYGQATDSLSMLPGTPLDVYYNLSSGNKDTVRNDNWHIAFAVRKAQPPLKTMQSATIRINEGRGVELYKTNKLVSDWNTLDTAGWATWPQFFNSDSSWDVGAFNQERNMTNPFDYGWGQYNMTTKEVTGNKIWLIAITTSPIPGAPKTLKKLAIHKIDFDSMWVFSYANINGSDSTGMLIRKGDFSNKLFAYVNMLSKTVIDREPASNTWDILFTRYKSMVTLFGQTLMYPVMGVLQHPNAISVKIQSPNAKSITPDTSLKFKSRISEIGWDWKVITVTPGVWPIKDSLSYVIQTGVNKYYRLYFTDYFADNTKQYIKFNKTFFSILNSSPEIIEIGNGALIYPNPVNEQTILEANFKQTAQLLNISIFDLSGRNFMNKDFNHVTGEFQTKLDLTNLKSGIYFVKVTADGQSISKKIVVN